MNMCRYNAVKLSGSMFTKLVYCVYSDNVNTIDVEPHCVVQPEKKLNYLCVVVRCLT